ncbi:hypothetical protein D3879_14905 [Pseudomonas cavernicola]|uniref:Uncharacterized protein n=1 Tax=Pseudomonas cavernicola TaxID=2320866 RepID=A0A418XEM9_9PSED|nr:hypothetical protein [Pseudomonas cavernicola]RJG10965.1 hypothetical protein D3879_14905 [Pseudomonas cavernicola]
MRWDGHRDAEPALAESLRQFTEAGVLAAAKALRRSTRTINRIAIEHGIQFTTGTAETMKSRRRSRDAMAAQIAQLAGTHTQAEICAALGITRFVLREIAEIHGIDINSRNT